jgi:hypothetical protein
VNEREDEEARKAANLGPDDGAQRGRISFEVVKRLIRSQVKDGPPNHAWLMVLQEGRKSCLPNLGVVAPYYLGKPEKGSKGQTIRAHVVGRRRTWSTS